jgi:hypothetical protein
MGILNNISQHVTRGGNILKPTTVNIIGQIADLKDTDYKNTLAITTLLELLIEKNFFSREEFAQKATELENATVREISLQRRARKLMV